ncbi:MAG: hypothetical protein JNN27_14890 [Planctomycetes bacterium]|nr:hypothetical protein [Planctomycetota bacterium]
MNLRFLATIFVAVTALALSHFLPYADKVGRFESLELVDPDTGKTVQIVVSAGSLVVRSAEWGERFEVSIGSDAGRSGVRIGDAGGHQFVHVGFAAEGIGPGIDIVDEKARSRGTFNIRSDRGPSLVLYGPEERPRAYLGPQPDGSSRLALFDRSGVPSVTATADDVNKLHGVALTHYGSDEVGLVISSDKKGKNAMTARTRNGDGISVVGVNEGKGGGLYLGQEDEKNSVSIRGGGDAMGELQFKSNVGAPLGGILSKEGDDGLALVLINKSGVPFVIGPPK